MTYSDQIKKLVEKYPIIKQMLLPALAVQKSFGSRQQMYADLVYKNLSNLLIEDPIVNISEFQGIFSIGVRSDLFKRLIFQNQYEPEIVKYCLKYLNRDRDVIDVGANIGFFTVMFAKNLNARKVLSVEPTENALKRLYRNIELNNVADSTIVFEGVASNQRCTTEIAIISGKEEYSSLGKMVHPSIAGESYNLKEVQAITLDELKQQYSLDPGFLKIDVEGAEFMVFEGAKSILENSRPIIMSELSDYLLQKNYSSSRKVLDFISQYDYDIFNPLKLDSPIETQAFTNIFCIPKELGKL